MVFCDLLLLLFLLQLLLLQMAVFFIVLPCQCRENNTAVCLKTRCRALHKCNIVCGQPVRVGERVIGALLDQVRTQCITEAKSETEVQCSVAHIVLCV